VSGSADGRGKRDLEPGGGGAGRAVWFKNLGKLVIQSDAREGGVVRVLKQWGLEVQGLYEGKLPRPGVLKRERCFAWFDV